jgi:hypothetical protein
MLQLRRYRIRISPGPWDFTSLPNFQIGFGYRFFFLGVEQQGREVNYPHPSSAKVPLCAFRGQGKTLCSTHVTGRYAPDMLLLIYFRLIASCHGIRIRKSFQMYPSLLVHFLSTQWF